MKSYMVRLLGKGIILFQYLVLKTLHSTATAAATATTPAPARDLRSFKNFVSLFGSLVGKSKCFPVQMEFGHVGLKPYFLHYLSVP